MMRTIKPYTFIYISALKKYTNRNKNIKKKNERSNKIKTLKIRRKNNKMFLKIPKTFIDSFLTCLIIIQSYVSVLAMKNNGYFKDFLSY